jgi:hypothetical protein
VLLAHDITVRGVTVKAGSKVHNPWTGRLGIYATLLVGDEWHHVKLRPDDVKVVKMQTVK